MKHSLITMTVEPLELLIRGAVVYLFVIVLIRLSGKRQLSQMAATEFVAILLISNAVQNSMNGGDNSLIAGLILAVVLVLLSWGISWINFRSKKLRAIFEGTPRLLIRHGQVIPESLKHELISENELRTILRKQGVHHVAEVKAAILESDGTLTIERWVDAAESATKAEKAKALREEEMKKGKKTRGAEADEDLLNG